MAVKTVDGELAQVMDSMPYGVYIIGSTDAAGEANGMMADWVMQVSFRPRQVAVSFENDAHTLANIQAKNWFSVNFLAASEEGRAEAARFLQPYDGSKVAGRTGDGRRRIHHKMETAAHTVTVHGVPVLSAAVAWVECEARQFIPVGDHTLVLGEVFDGRLLIESDALSSAYTGWTYSG